MCPVNAFALPFPARWGGKISEIDRFTPCSQGHTEGNNVGTMEWAASIHILQT